MYKTVFKQFVSLFTDNATVAERSVWGIRVFMIGIIPLAFQYTFVDGLTALGQPKFAVALSMTRKLGFYLGATLILPALLDVKSVFYAESIADIGGAMLSTVVFLVVFSKILKKRDRLAVSEEENGETK